MKRPVLYIIIGIITLIFTIHYTSQQAKRVYSGIKSYNSCSYKETSNCNDRYASIKTAIKDNENIYVFYKTKQQKSRSWFRFQIMYLSAPIIPKEFADDNGKQDLLRIINDENNFLIISQVDVSELNERTNHKYIADEYYIYENK